MLREVSFWCDKNNDYTVKVYKNPTLEDGVVKNPCTGTLIGTASGTEAFAGFHTTSISCNDTLQNGDRYSVVLYLKSASGRVSIYNESNFNEWGELYRTEELSDTSVAVDYYGNFTCAANILPGQSLISTNGNSFTDVTEHAAHLSYGAGNFRIKASTTDVCQLSVSEDEVLLNEGDTYFQAPIIVKGHYNGAYHYSSSNPDVASVSPEGTVSANGFGMATITIDADDGASVSYIVRVCRYMEDCTVSDIEVQQYTGEPIIPEILITYGSEELTQGEDYIVTASNNTAEGIATATISGQGNYIGSAYANFEIKDMGLQVTLPKDEYTYTGQKITPEPVVTLSGNTLHSDAYKVTYYRNQNVGTAKIKVSVSPSGLTTTKTFRIKPLDLKQVTAQPIQDQIFEGTEVEPTVTLTNGSIQLVSGNDYTVSYANNDKIRTAFDTELDPQAVVTGIGNYEGTIILPFSIISGTTEEGTISLKKAIISNVPTKDYTGKQIKQQPSVVLKKKALVEGEDYYLTYESNVNVGTAKMTIHGMGEYKDTVTKKFKIRPLSLASTEITVSLDQYVYTATGAKPDVTCTVTDRKGNIVPESAYEISVTGGKKAGKATVKVKARSHTNYSGSKRVTIYVTKTKVDLVPLTVQEYDYTGKYVKPKITECKDTAGNTYTVGKDCKLTYLDNKNAGTAVIILTGKGIHRGKTGYLTYTIKQVDGKQLTGTIKNMKYNKKAQFPKPVIKYGSRKLKIGTDYDLYYYDNIEVGTGTVYAVMKGNYKGYISKTFMIQ